MSSRRWTIALCLWSLAIWTTRIGNIWNDDALTDSEKWGRTGLALSFTVLAVVVGLAVHRRADWLRIGVLAFAGWTVGVWTTRSIGIATGDHEAAFIVVHLILATVSIALAVLAARETASEPITEG